MNLPDRGTRVATIYDFIEFSVKSHQQKSDLYRHLYLEKGLSAAQIAQKFDCAKSTVLRRLAEKGIRKFRDCQDSPSNYRLPQAPYGYSVREGRLVPNRREMKVCRLVVELRERGEKTFSEISRELVRRRIKNRRGQVSWQHVTVANIYKRWRGKL